MNATSPRLEFRLRLDEPNSSALWNAQTYRGLVCAMIAEAHRQKRTGNVKFSKRYNPGGSMTITIRWVDKHASDPWAIPPPDDE